MRGNAIMLPSSARMPSLRTRLSGEPAIGSGMWPAHAASASCNPSRARVRPVCFRRSEAVHARHIASRVYQPDLLEVLHRVAQDYDDIAEDLEHGAIEIRHPELMPQGRR